MCSNLYQLYCIVNYRLKRKFKYELDDYFWRNYKISKDRDSVMDGSTLQSDLILFFLLGRHYGGSKRVESCSRKRFDTST